MTNNLVVASNNGWRLVAFSLIAYWISLVLILKTRRDVSVVSFSSSLSSSSSVEARGRQIRLAVITPTFHREKNRNFQTIQLLALQNTLCSTGGMGMIWILVESESDWRKSSLVERYEREERPAYCERVLVKALRVKVERSKHRGVAQRNKALDWLEQQISYVEQDPVVLFVDDDNAYAAEHFVRATKIGKVGVWPVGFPSTKSKFEAPVVKAQHQSDALQSSSSSSSTKVVGFRSFWCGDLKTFKPRVFNVDMSGFGIRLHALEKVRFDENVRSGYLEDAFLQAITRNVLRRDNKTSENENEGNPLHLLNALETTNVSEIFVWHLYHTVLSGKTPAALVVSKVPKGDSFLCP
jgi:galactosylgalactosylxylosylprotein 3-beta-glucuronosyltransferase 3